MSEREPCRCERCPNPDCHNGKVLLKSGRPETIDCPTCEGQGRVMPEPVKAIPLSRLKELIADQREDPPENESVLDAMIDLQGYVEYYPGSCCSRCEIDGSPPITDAGIEDVKFLLALLPVWAKDVPAGLDPTFYGTLSKDGDKVVNARVEKIRAAIEAYEAERTRD